MSTVTISKVEKLKLDYLSKLDSCNSREELEAARIEIFGKNSELSNYLKSLGSMSSEEKRAFGPLLNKLRAELQRKLQEKETIFEERLLQQQIEAERIDVSIDVAELSPINGRIHPITAVIHDVRNIFAKYGFVTATGPDIETDYYNFTALNFPSDHPAREMHDTFFIKSSSCDVAEDNKILLRTHTSPVQIRSMEVLEPPIRVIIPGKTYRKDEDATHSPMFHQLEGLIIDQTVSMAHMKWLLEEFCKEFFNTNSLSMRFRPSFFPFTQPSMEVDINCEYKDEKLHIGTGDKWLEILGCGMVHPNVLENGNIDSKKYQGFAWGVGIERLAMLKYGIKDLRAFFNGDADWLQYHSFRSLNCLERLNAQKL